MSRGLRWRALNAFFSGVNLPDLLVRLSIGERLELAETRSGVRTRQTVLGLLAAAATGRAAVLREVWRAIAGSGMYQGAREGLTPVCHDPLSAVPGLVVLARLLANPGSAARISDEAVQWYAISHEAVTRIARM